jgi:VWFA-related protein
VLLALCAIGQQPAFRSGVEMLEVDARVFDRDGRFVADLTLDDFEVLEDGKRQTIRTFFLVGTTADAAGSEAAGRPRGPHTWIFVVDQRHMDLNGFHRARTGIRGFLEERFRPGDLAGLVFNDRLINGRISSSREEQLAALAQVVLPESVTSPRTGAALERALMDTMRTLDELARGLAPMPGPKTVVLLSDGFDLSGKDVGPLVRAAGTLRNVVGRLARAGARLYAIDTRGIAGAPDNGLNTLAIDTGGLVLFNLNNIGAAFDEVAADTNVYYVLGYQPENTRFDGKYRELDVRVKREGVTVRARKGYLAVEPAKLLVPQRD